MKAEVVTTDVPFAEGPVWCPDGTVAVTSVTAGAVYRVWPEDGRAEAVATTSGGANGAVLASDGGLLVTQNGGLDFSGMGLFGEVPPVTPNAPGLQRVHPDGAVTSVAEGGYRAPNDLAVTPDGTVLFTDPGPFPPPKGERVGRVFALHPDGSVTLHAEGFWFCNGIGVEDDGSVVVVEKTGLLRLLPDGGREWVVEHLGDGAGDGFCLDAEGRFYVASTVEHGVRVVERDGTVVDFLPIPGDGITTNCCFGGPDLRTLYATDATPGGVVVWEGMPTPGRPLPTWEVPS